MAIRGQVAPPDKSFGLSEHTLLYPYRSIWPTVVLKISLAQNAGIADAPVGMWLRRTSVGLTILTYLLIVWGGIVRRSESGLGCPDWPLCHGQLIPPTDPATLIEYTHRLLAAFVSLLLVALVIGIWRSPILRRSTGRLALAALVLLAAQAVLGGMVVITELKPWLVAGHLALAFLFLGTIIWTVSSVVSRQSSAITETGQRPTIDDRSRLSVSGWLALIALYLQILLGGIVSGHQAGLACPDFPTCQGQWWPVFQGLVAMQMTHRIGAVVTTILVCVFVLMSWNRRRLWLILFVLALQIALGIGNVLMGLPFVMDVAHLAVATALFGLLCKSVGRLSL